MDELGSVLLNKQAFFHVLAFCSTLNPPQSHLFLMFTSFHVISYFSLSSHISFAEEIAIAIAIGTTVFLNSSPFVAVLGKVAHCLLANGTLVRSFDPSPQKNLDDDQMNMKSVPGHV